MFGPISLRDAVTHFRGRNTESTIPRAQRARWMAEVRHCAFRAGAQSIIDCSELLKLELAAPAPVNISAPDSRDFHARSR
jgi:hypothetical protein